MVLLVISFSLSGTTLYNAFPRLFGVAVPASIPRPTVYRRSEVEQGPAQVVEDRGLR